jgi:aryl-alcohol dehydrogenase-like predicted oxidoreductase
MEYTEIVENRGVSARSYRACLAVQKKPVTAPIIGATKITHLEDAAGVLSVKLIQEEVTYLEEPYVPHSIVGHQ